MWIKLGWLAFAGMLGTLARYGLGELAKRWWGDGFPVGTLVINVLGCFLFGLVWTLADERLIISSETRLIILTGFMGAFTTFSTFGYETAALLNAGQRGMALLNIGLQNIVGIGAVFGGFIVGRWF